eukprot:m51a1_g4520 hypothetical protein (550) ;mRNA; r:429860-432283
MKSVDLLIVVGVGGAVVLVAVVCVAVCLCQRARGRRYRSSADSATPSTALLSPAAHARSPAAQAAPSPPFRDSGALRAAQGAVAQPLARDRDAEAESNAALMNALFFLRSVPKYTLDQPLPDIGARVNKFYFNVTPTEGAKVPHVLCLTHNGSSCPFSLRTEGQVFKNIIQSVTGHPYVATPSACDWIASRDICAVVRPLRKRGSLRDFIHQDNPLNKYHKKAKGLQALPERTLAKLARQIIEGMRYLRFNGLPCFHLHAGNVLVDGNGACCVTEYENGLLCLEPRNLNIMRALIGKVDPDVVCFGCMAVGCELTSLDMIDMVLPKSKTCPASVRRVVESIFRPWSGSPPGFDDLMRMQPFDDVELAPMPRHKAELGAREQQLCALACDAMRALVAGNAAASPTSARQQRRHRRTSTALQQPQPQPQQQQAPQASQEPLGFTALSQLYYAGAPAGSPAAAAAPAAPQAPQAPLAAPQAPQAQQRAAPAQQARSVSPVQQSGTPTPPPPPPPPPQSAAAATPAMTEGRGALLSSICGFDAGRLKKVKSPR